LIGESEKLRFEILCRRLASGELHGEGIGTYSEKRLHKILKHYFCEDENCHEVRIRPNGEAVTDIAERSSGAESGRGGFIADVFDNGKIVEIQTGGFYPLKPKIAFYLNKCDYDVTVVHPVAAAKWVSWIDPESGAVGKRSKSPKKGVASDVLPEFFWLSEYLKNERLHFKIVLLNIEEYRLLDGWSRDKKRGSNRYDRVPTELVDIVSFDASEFAKILIPQGLSEEFTSTELSKLTRFKGRKLSFVLKLLCDTKAAERCGKRGNAYVYKLIK
jgi:hypothetical protein